jgi:hypothetical protein
MSGPRAAVSARAIQDALSATTERLARELREPDSNAPEWSAFEWDVARATATLHGLSGLLARRLAWTGPPAWESFLAAQLDHARGRDAIIGRHLERIENALRAQGVGAIPLKGAALRTRGLYDSGERPMGDIDLLVSPERLAGTGTALRAAGFVPSFVTERHSVFTPAESGAGPAFGEHVDNPVKVEVHTRIAENLPVREVDVTGRLVRGPLRPGFNDYADDVELLRHLLLHAAGNMRAHALRLLQLHDIAVLARRLGPHDWVRLIEPDDRATSWWMLPPLTLASRCFPGPIPSSALDALARLSPRRIARLAKRCSLVRVSWSNLRIHALPGVGWSRSPFEAARFAFERAFPRRARLEMLSNSLAHMPVLREVSWYERSQAARIALWVFRRPPRVQTMVAVNAALAGGATN